jgi:hypothetical protein
MGSKLPKLGQASARMSGRRLIVSGNIRKQHTAQQRFIEKGVESVRLDVQFYRGLWKSGSVTGDLAYPNVPSVNDISCMDLPNGDGNSGGSCEGNGVWNGDGNQKDINEITS